MVRLDWYWVQKLWLSLLLRHLEDLVNLRRFYWTKFHNNWSYRRTVGYNYSLQWCLYPDFTSSQTNNLDRLQHASLSQDCFFWCNYLWKWHFTQKLWNNLNRWFCCLAICSSSVLLYRWRWISILASTSRCESTITTPLRLEKLLLKQRSIY